MHLSQKFKHLILLCLVPPGQLPAGAAREIIPLQEALQRAVAADPRLELAAAMAEAADGQVEQAGLRPNPVVGAEFENFLGTGPVSGVSALEVTIGIRQTIETAGKRQRRTALAEAERARVDWRREAVLAEVEASVRAAFVDVLLAQEMQLLREEQLALAGHSARETARMVEAARSPQVELARAELAVRQQQFALQQAGRDLAIAKSLLAGLWGESGTANFEVSGEIRLEPRPPEFAELAAGLANTAALARYAAEETVRAAALELEQARARPDVELFAGGRYYNEGDGDAGFVVGVEMPWPLFDRNQGNIRTARAQLRAVSLERAAARRAVLTALNHACQRLAAAQAEAEAIESGLLPAAEATLRETEAGYERGQFTQLAVLESRAALFDIRESHLQALRAYAHALAEIEALTRPTNN